MSDTALTIGFTDPPRQAARAFRVLLNAMARPGRLYALEGTDAPLPLSEAAALTLLTLCDPETPVFLAGTADTPAVRNWLTFNTGAPLTGPEHCAFAVGRWDALLPLDRYPLGTDQYPDRSATLIVEMDALTNTGTTLAGPGIDGTVALSVPDPTALTANRRLFPRGLDMILTAGSTVAGLPRSVRVL